METPKTNSDGIWDKLIPNVKTDHGGINGADVVVLVVDFILLLYTGYRSWHFLDGTFAGSGSAGEYAILAVIGLIGLDVGAVAWSLVWMFGSSTKWQDRAAMTMFIIDVVGMTLTSMVDSLNGANAETPLLLRTGALYLIPFIIILNVVIGILYHMVSPSTKLSREKRQMLADMKRKAELAELAIAENNLKLDLAQRTAGQREDLLAQQSKLADLNRKLDALEHSIRRTLTDSDRVPAAPESKPEQPQAEAKPQPDPEAAPSPNAKAIADLNERIARLTELAEAQQRASDPIPPVPSPVNVPAKSNGHKPIDPEDAAPKA